METIPTGAWVEIEQIILKPEERAPSLPEDTRKVPFILHVSGFLTNDSQVGQTATIRTIIGRLFTGKLITVNPSYNHSFGSTVPELLTIGTEAEQ